MWNTNSKYYKPQSELLGFKEGYVNVFTGPTYENKEYLKGLGATFRTCYGWALAGGIPIPQNLPEGLSYFRLNWDEVGNPDGNLKDDKTVQAVMDKKLYPVEEGEYVGTVGERLDLYLTVERNIVLDGAYGTSYMMVMSDDFGHTFVWTTSTKSWAEGTDHHIKGTVKEHKSYKGVLQTILTRCSEAK